MTDPLRARNRLGVVFFPAFDWAISATHPEREERLLYTRDQLAEEGLFDIPGITEYRPELATDAQVERVHFCLPSTGAVVTDSHRASAGGAITAARLVMEKKEDKAFALVRPPAHHRLTAEAVGLLRRAGKDGVFLQKAVLLIAEKELPLVQKGDVVTELLQIREDVGGDEDGVVLLPGELVEQFQHLVPDDGVQAGGGLIQHQQLGIVGQGGGDGQLHFHAPGEVLELFVPGEGEAVQIAVIAALVPAAIGLGKDLSHLDGVERLGEVGLIQHHPHVLLGGEDLRGIGVYPQQGAAAAVRPQDPQHQADGGGFSGAVFPHQSADGAAGNGQGQVLDGKARKGLAHMGQFNGIHKEGSSFCRMWSISVSSPEDTPHWAASSTAAVR